MSQRNPQNQRYINRDENFGKSRKSAASAKPKSGAGSSVRTVSRKASKDASKSRSEKRAASKQERDRQWEAEQRYGDPPTKKFKIYKRIWLIGLILAVAFIAASFFVTKVFDELPQYVMYVLIGCSYACIIIVLYIDLAKIRRMRREYAARMNKMRGKELRAAQKAERAAAREAAKAEAEKAESEPTEDMSFKGKLKKFFSRK